MKLVHKVERKDDNMKIINLEKTLELNTVYDELQHIEMDCKAEYIQENDGIQVNGELIIDGSALNQHIKKQFQEKVVLDLFVTKEKLDGTPFSLTLKEYQAELKGNELYLELTFEIMGMGDENKVNEEENGFYDLFENDEDTYVCSVMAVVKEDDTYASIAREYQVSEACLREYNQHKPLSEKMLVRIPLENDK